MLGVGGSQSILRSTLGGLCQILLTRIIFVASIPRLHSALLEISVLLGVFSTLRPAALLLERRLSFRIGQRFPVWPGSGLLKKRSATTGMKRQSQVMARTSRSSTSIGGAWVRI